MDDFEFKKIELNEQHKKEKKLDNINPVKKTKKILLFLSVFFLIFLIFTLFLGLQAKSIYAKALNVSNQAKVALDAAKKQNIIVFRDELVKTEKELSILKKDVDSLSFLKFVPIFNLYYSDTQHLLNASSYGISSGLTVADSLIPYADVLGLKGEKSFVSGSAQDRIQIAVKTMGKVVPNIDAIEGNLTKAKEEIDQVDENHYPNLWKFKKIKEQIGMVKTITDESVLAIQEAKPLIKVLPELLGEPNETKYLIIFQNDKELRPTGGFITFYAVFRVEHGVMHIDNASDIYELDNSIASHPKAGEIILKYLPKVYTANIRDSNLSPDFEQSMKDFMELYNKSSKKSKIDGIIALDTHVLVNVLNILGDVSVGGINFSAKNDPRCNCPQVVYQLEAMADQPVNYVKENRKSIIGELLYAIMQKAFSSSPKLYWGRLFQQVLVDAQEKHVLFSLFNKDAQDGLRALNLTGKIKEFEGDYLHINNSNFAGAKSNMFVKESVKMDYSTSDGKITKTLTIDYKNPYPHSDCDLERGGLCLNATLRDYLRIYVPKGSTLLESKGSQVKVGEKEDLGKTMFDGFLEVRPQNKSQIVFKYQLPFKVEKGSKLPVLIQKQPGTDGTTYEINVNGKLIESFVLKTDKTLNLKLY